jgi:hypothetical protein
MITCVRCSSFKSVPPCACKKHREGCVVSNRRITQYHGNFECPTFATAGKSERIFLKARGHSSNQKAGQEKEEA